MNTQPNSFTWNLMGMMNNCVYRVKIHPAVSNGALALKYEHPTIAGPAVGGWMNPADALTIAAEEVRTYSYSFMVWSASSITSVSMHIGFACLSVSDISSRASLFNHQLFVQFKESSLGCTHFFVFLMGG